MPAKNSIGNVVIGVNTVKGGIEANGDGSGGVSQIGQGLATAFQGGAETIFCFF